MISPDERRGQKRWADGIAIVGMSARFPGCPDVDAYWRNLLTGKDLLSVADDAMLREAGIDPAQAEEMHFVRSGTSLEDAELFDARFFEMTRREAEIMDPQQRIFLECAYQALEHAGMTGEGERVGVFAGAGMNTYMMQLLGNPELLASAGGYQLMLGNDKDYLATRVAYKLNLRGPAVVVQTACSTSLAAVHLACQSLLLGECDSALAGGVSVTFPQVAGYAYVPGMILSPDGVCRPFDERAKGTVPGKGAGLVVLKRLADAQREGDTIYGVIAGSAWNNDGAAKVGYTAPSVEGQVAVIRAAHAAANVHADRIGYVEAHGTGTELGDPIEVAALAEAFGTRGAEMEPCLLGSVKANMGHADVAAGIAGLIKAALAVYHGVIPPTPHFERAHLALGLERTPFRVSAEATPWTLKEGERWAGVSSFGIGGTNVHVCLRSAPLAVVAGERAEGGGTGAGPWVFPLSAKTASSLEAGAARLAGFLGDTCETASLGAIAQTLARGRRAYPFRRALVAATCEDLAVQLWKTAKAAGGTRAGKVAFLFPGQGMDLAGQAAALLSRDEPFRSTVEEGLALLDKALAAELRACLEGTKETAGPLPTRLAQPLLFLVEFALARRWMALGVRPGALLGHSLGELTAATVAGVFSFADGMRLAAERGHLMQAAAAGAMLAVSLPAGALHSYLSGALWIAAENAPELTVLSGETGAIEDVEKQLGAARIACVRLATDRAFHTPAMNRAAASFGAAVAAVARHAPQMPWLSNVTGNWIQAEEALRPEYWADQMLSRVRFREDAAELVKGRYFLLEVGPGDALMTMVRQQERNLMGTASFGGHGVRTADGYSGFLKAAARLWESGIDLRWEQLPGWRSGGLRRIALPTYAFERERFWVEASPAGTRQIGAGQKTSAAAQFPALEKRDEISSWFYAPSWQRTPSFTTRFAGELAGPSTWLVLDDHRGLGRAIAERLRASGAKVLRVGVSARASLTAGSNGSSPELAVDPAIKADFERFWKSPAWLDHHGDTPGLINCWTVAGMGDGVGVDPYRSLLLLLQTAQTARVRFAQVEIVADGLAEVHGERVEGARRGLLEGMVSVLPAEFAGMRCRVIDPGWLGRGESAGGSSVALEDAAQQICNELRRPMSAGTTTIAFREGLRWQQVWMPLDLPAPAASRLRMRGTYVITGGLGGVGYLIARHLLTHYQANVALVGRTALPPRERWEEWLTEHGREHPMSRRIQRAKDLEAVEMGSGEAAGEETREMGGRFQMLVADVADAAAMAAAWGAAEARFGMVHGVIHAAGMPGGQRVAAQDAAAVDEVLRPKVEGSEVLARLLAEKPVDFLLFCSSISVVLPVAGASSYAAANAFQDRFATWCRQHLGVPALSINFDAWQEQGMAAEMASPAGFEHLKEARLRRAMRTDEALTVFERGLAANQAQVLVSTVALPALLQPAEEELRVRAFPAGGREIVARSAGATHGSGPLLPADTAAVVAIWQELLGAEGIGPEDNFFELGGHSLLGTMVLSRIREQFGVELSIRAIFEASTPGALGRRIREAIPAEPETQPVGVPGDREEFEI